jgi:uncharacterized membrane protein
MQSTGGFGGVFEMTSARLVLNIAGLAVLGAVGFYLIGKLRGQYRESDQVSSHLLDNFRELHTRGQLSDEEYRNIKSKLASQLRDELKTREESE